MAYRDLISEVITGESFLGSVYFNTAEGFEGNITKRTENVKFCTSGLLNTTTSNRF